MANTTIYLIDSTDGGTTFAIQPRTFDGIGGVQINTDLTLYGNATPSWGERFNENFYKLLENFAEYQSTTFDPVVTTPPTPQNTNTSIGSGINNPIIGQLWYNKTDGKLYIFAPIDSNADPVVGYWRNTAASSTTKPTTPLLGDLWYDGSTNLINFYNGSIWVALAASSGGSFVSTAGDTMTGFLTLSADPTSALHATTKQYVDSSSTDKVTRSGDTMTGFLTLSADPTSALHATTKQYVDSVTGGSFVDIAGDTMTGDLAFDVSSTAKSIIFNTGGSFVKGGNIVVEYTAAGFLELTTNYGSGGVKNILTIDPFGTSKAQFGEEVWFDKNVLLSGSTTATGNITMDGSGLILDHDPILTLEAATKQYVDTNGGVGIGFVLPFAVNVTPSGFLRCNGSAVSRTVYGALFTALGTLYGVGDGSTTFNLPDLRGEFLRGWDDGRGADLGRAIGTFQADEIKAHTHNMWNTAINISTSTGAGHYSHSLSKGTATTSTGGSETRPRNIAMLYCIKY